MNLYKLRYDYFMKIRSMDASKKGKAALTKRERPAVTTRTARKRAWKSPKGILAGKVKIIGDIVNFDTSELWDALRRD
jgi:hypothetical protein